MPRSPLMRSARKERGDTACGHQRDHDEQARDQEPIAMSMSGQQNRRRDCARAGQKRNRARKSGDVAYMLFDSLLGGFAFPPDANAKDHFRGD